MGGCVAEGNLDEALKTFFKELPQRRESALAELEQRWEETENPLYVWSAWRFSREAGLSIPEWVAEYFDSCSRMLLTYSTNTASKNRIEDVPALLGFVSKAPFKTYLDNFIRHEAVAIVRQEFERDPTSRTAYRVAANVLLQRYGADYSERTIKNWHDEID
jgi:hypothetical protein